MSSARAAPAGGGLSAALTVGRGQASAGTFSGAHNCSTRATPWPMTADSSAAPSSLNTGLRSRTPSSFHCRMRLTSAGT